MKKYKFALIAVAFIVSTTASFAQSALEKGIKLQTPSSIAQHVNKNSSPDEADSSDTSSLSDNPFLNSYINGMGNMARGMGNNSFDAQNQQKQQLDYAKQQVKD